MKRVISILLCIALAFSCLSLSVGAANVVLSSQNLTVNGRPVECEKYNIDGSNYFKLRDIAYLLNGTTNQFEVGYDSETRTVTVTSGIPYTPNGEELIVGMDKSETAQPSTQSIIINGVVNSSISAYNLAGNNFFKLRDLGDVLGFIVDYDKASNTAIILSSNNAPSPTPAPSPELPSTSTSELNAEQVFEKCSPAVVYIVVYDTNGNAFASGSGFFLESNGVLVTNYHVIDGCYYATIETSDSQKTYNVLGVYDYSIEQDWAVLKVDGTGFSTLSIGNSSTIVGGAKVFALGSPRGLANTLSEGVISNPSRQFGDMTYIQTDAAISHGSSGGALINKYGEVIGITSAGYDDAQNLNFAIPLSYVTYSTSSEYTSLQTIALANKQNAPGNNGGDALSIQAQTYSVLKQWILENYNDTIGNNKDKGYFVTSNFDNGDSSRVAVVYISDGDRIVLYYSYRYSSGANDYSYIHICPGELSYRMSYQYYGTASQQDPSFEGSVNVYAPDFSGNKNIIFNNVSGPYANTTREETMVHYAMLDFTNALDFTEYIFDYYIQPYGSYSILDFGFDPNKLEVSDTPSEQTAYDCLITFVKGHYNDRASDKYIFAEKDPTEDVTRKVIYDSASGTVSVQRVEHVELGYEYNYDYYEYWSTITYSPDTTNHTLTYSYYETSTITEPTFRAYSNVYAPGFDGSNLRFSNIDIDYGYNIEFNESVASSMLQDMLIFTDHIFSSYLSDFGVFEVSLFGFTNYKSSEVEGIKSGENDTTLTKEAYDSLIDFIKANNNGGDTQTLVYSELGNTSTGYIDYQLLYDNSWNDVMAQRVEVYNDQMYIINIIISPESYFCSVLYSYYDNRTSETPAFSAFSNVYAPGFNGENLKFTEVDVNSGYEVSLNETIASAHLQNILYFTDIVLNSYLSDDGVFGIDLFGFTNYMENQ